VRLIKPVASPPCLRVSVVRQKRKTNRVFPPPKRRRIAFSGCQPAEKLR
jgi:hypothetical protein